jgi:hypothetical protein
MLKTHDLFRGGLPRKALLPAALLLVFLLAGCADKPYEGSPGPPDPLSLPSPSIIGSTPPPHMPDPLLSGPGRTPTDPLLQHNAFAGPVMPTAHSHWLRGHLRDVHVTVLLNGIRHGEFSGVLDQDITMKLRPGVNMVTFRYQPVSSHSAVNLEIVEGEHDPSIAPLVTFQSDILPVSNSSSALMPVSKTFMFIAN